MRAGPPAALPGVAGDAPRRATAPTVAVMCLLLAVKLSYGAAPVGAGEVPWVVALFVLPLLYAFPGPRRRPLFGLVVYGLSRLAGLARQLEGCKPSWPG